MIVKDNNNRELLKIEGGKIAISRYKNLEKEYISIISKTFSDLTGEKIDEVVNFLEFKNNKFCKFCS